MFENEQIVIDIKLTIDREDLKHIEKFKGESRKEKLINLIKDKLTEIKSWTKEQLIYKCILDDNYEYLIKEKLTQSSLYDRLLNDYLKSDECITYCQARLDREIRDIYQYIKQDKQKSFNNVKDFAYVRYWADQIGVPYNSTITTYDKKKFLIDF